MTASLLAWIAAAAAFGVAFRHHQKRSGNAPAGALLALLVLGSGCLFELLSPQAGVGAWIATACVAGALFIAYEREPFPGGRPAEIYPDTQARLFPYLSILLILVALRWSPVSCLFVAPVVAALPRERRKAPVAFALLGIAAVFALLLLRSGEERGWPSAATVLHHLDPQLLGWNLAYLLAGRNVGLLMWFVPILLLIACYRPKNRRSWLMGAVAIGAVALPLIEPHNFWGGPEAVTNRAFLPLYAGLWFVPLQVPRHRWLTLTALAAGLMIWPAWWSPLATAAGEQRPWLADRSVAGRLPYETTQRHAPAYAEWQGIGVLSRSLRPTLRDTDDGPQFAAADGRAEVMIASERPLESALIDFGPRGGSALEVAGGRPGNTVFRPDGGVRFEILLEGSIRRHRLWLDDRRRHIYLFEIGMPDAPERPLPVAIMARPADALPRSLDPSTAGESR